MKYQIIIETHEQMADDEFERRVRVWLPKHLLPGLIEARSLEGIRPEVWQRDDIEDLL